MKRIIPYHPKDWAGVHDIKIIYGIGRQIIQTTGKCVLGMPRLWEHKNVMYQGAK